MKFSPFLLMTLIAFSAASAELRTLPWSAQLNRAERYFASSSGKLTISRNAAENAIQFDVVFPPDADFWCYPLFTFNRPLENFGDAELLQFDIKAVQADDKAGFGPVLVFFDSERLPYPAPTGEWQTVTIRLADLKKNLDEVKGIKIGMNPRSPGLTYFLRNVKLLTTKPFTGKIEAAAVVRATAPGTVFTENEPLEFTLEPGFSAAKYLVRDWRGNAVRNGNWPDGGNAPLRLAPLPVGYYTLEPIGELKYEGNRSFTVVPDPAARRRNPDTFFALDSAQSWLGRPDAGNSRFPGEGYETISELARRAGTEHIRERLSWSDVEPVRGKFVGREYMKNADLLSRRGIRVLGMYHNAPAWAKNRSPKLPDDLVATYDFAKKAASAFAGKMAAWEFWNEQDIGFTDEPAWDYAANLKAAGLGFKAADPNMPVLIGGIAMTPLAPYNDVVMQNGAGAYFDILNVHTYRPLRDYPEIVADIRKFMARHGIAGVPLWFTENGSHAEGSGRAPSHIPGLKAHSPEQELLVAEFLPKCMIYMQSLGVDRDYFFVLSAYSEQNGSKDWGLLRRDYTAKPGYAAFATLTAQLGDAEYLGELKCADNIRAFLYRRPDGSQTLAYWTLSELDREGIRPDLTLANSFAADFAIPAADGEYGLTDLVGGASMVKAGNGKLALRAERFPAYVSGLSGLVPNRPFTPTPKAAFDAAGIDKTVIFKTVLSPDFILGSGKDRVDLKQIPAHLTIQVFNLSDTEKSGKLTVSGGRTTGLPDTVTVPPFGKTQFPIEFTPEMAAGTYRTDFVIEGLFQGRKVSRLTMPVTSLAKMVSEGRQVELTNATDPQNWRKNSSGAMEISFDAAERALKFQTQFPEGVDRWVYPEYILQLPQESLRGAYGLSFEVKAAPAAAKQMLVMAVLSKEKENGKALHLPVNRPGAEWQERIVSFDKIDDPAQIEMLRIGLNANAADITYWIRNLKVIYLQ